MSYPCTFYKAPCGKKQTVEIKNILEEDEVFFKQFGVILSMEQLQTEFVVYGRLPHQEDDDEIIVFAHERPCEETLNELANELRMLVGVPTQTP